MPLTKEQIVEQPDTLYCNEGVPSHFIEFTWLQIKQLQRGNTAWH